MKCPQCGAEIYDGLKTCPFCKLPTKPTDTKFKNFDFKYTITSKEQIKAIHDTVNEVARIAALDKGAISEAKKKKTHKKRRIYKKSERKRNKKFAVKGKNLGRAKLFGAAFPIVCILLVLAVAAAVICGVSAVSSETEVKNVYTYSQKNSLSLVFKGKSVKLTDKALDENYIRKTELTDSDVTVSEKIDEVRKSILRLSENGRRLYYFENYDPETQSGELMMIENGKERRKTHIASAVHSSLILSRDGKSLLYLESTDKNGDMGVLYYWKKGMKEPYKISTDIDKGSFGFSADCCEALFIQNFDRVNMQGDLQAKSLKHLNEEKKHIDTGVCSSFGTDVKTDAYIYAKNFSLDDKTYEIYAKDRKDKILRLGERTNKPPVLQKNGRIIAYGNETENTYNLYNIKVSDGSKEKLASNIKNIEYISSGGELIIYSKVYDEKIADYFVYMRGKQPQKIASNVSVDYKTVKAAQQFAVSKDFSRCAYIADFNEEKSGGALYTCALKGRNAAKAVKAAEDVYFCSYSDNGKFVFGKDYSKSRQVLDVWALSGEKISAVCEDVDPELLAVSGSGENIYYIADYKVSGDFGNLMKMSLKGKKEQLESEVFAFDTGEIGDILIYKNINIENGGSFDFYMLKGGKGKLLEIDTEINNVFLMQR